MCTAQTDRFPDPPSEPLPLHPAQCCLHGVKDMCFLQLLSKQPREGVCPAQGTPTTCPQDDLLFSVALLSLGSNSRTNCPSSLSLSNHLVGKRGAISSLSGGARQPTITQFMQSHQEARALNSAKGNGSTRAQNKGSQPRLGKEGSPGEVISG